MDVMRFRDRRDAGEMLAGLLGKYASRSDLLVLALPRGGVPVAFEIARALDAPLDVFLVRKLGLPGQEEVAMGAIASGGVRVVNHDLVAALRIQPDVLDVITARETRELRRREEAYRGDAPPLVLRDRTIILVDDGVATGSSVLAALRALRMQRPAWIVVAAPVIAAQARALLLDHADDVVSVIAPARLDGVGRWYADFRQTTDDEVRALLEASASVAPQRAGPLAGRP
jgi:predicted phosphoribosyltransferase